MEAANVDEAVNKTNLSDYKSSKPTFEYPANRGATRAETESMSDGSNFDTQPDLHEEARGLLQFSAEFDPNFHPENAPRIALLCQTCHTALQTASLLAQSDKQRQQLTSEALRVKVWGMDMFESSNSTPLDELLGIASGNHTSLRCHLMGVWADIAATLEIILYFLLRQPGSPSPESCTQWRRLRIVIGLDDISSAIHDGFSLPVTFDRHDGSSDGSELLSSLINSLEDLVDCLFDLLVTIGTIRQLHKLGFESNISNQPPFRATEVQVADTSNKTVEVFSASSSPVVDVVSKANPLLTSNSYKGQRIRNQGPGSGLTDSERLKFSESASQEIPRERPGKSTSLSHEAMHDGPLKPQTESVRQKASPESLDTMNAPIILGDELGNSIETSKRGLAADPSRFQKPIKFIDCHGRTFTFPFSLCCTWTGMQSLIKEGFEGLTGLDADTTREFIEHGKYDLVSHFDNETIMPSLWGSVLEPGMTVRMMLYQLPPIIRPRAHPYQGTQYADLPFEYHLNPFQNASTSSSNRRVHNSVDEGSRNSQDEAIAERKGSQYVDTEMTNSVNVTLAQTVDAPPPIVPSKSTKEKSSDIGENHDRASYGDKKRNKKTTTPSFQSGNSGTAYEVKPFYSPRPRRLHGAVSSSAKLPKFEDFEIGRNTHRSAAPPTSGRDLGYPTIPMTIPMSFKDSALGGMGSTVSSYPYPAHSYISQPDMSDINNTKLVPPRTLSPVPSILAARLSTEPPSRPPTLTQYPDGSQGYSELKQLLLDEKAARQASELAAKKLEDERRARAEKELLAVKEIAADAAVAAAAAASERAEFASKEAEKVAAKSRKAEVERNESVIPAGTKTKPRAIHLKDSYKRSFVFPYDLSSTWQGMKGLIDKSFLHDERIHAHIIEGHYDLLDPSGDIIPPALWEYMITPGMTVELKLWHIPESSLNELENQKEPSTVRHSLISKYEHEISHLQSGDEEEISDVEPGHKGRFSGWKDRLLRPSRMGGSAVTYTDVEDA